MYNPPPQREDQLNDVLKRITRGEAILFTQDFLLALKIKIIQNLLWVRRYQSR